MRKLFSSAMMLAFACLVMPGFASTPIGFVNVYANHWTDSAGNPVASATITFSPVSNTGTPINYRINGSGQAISRAVSATVTNGAFSVQLADTALTSPQNICYSVTMTDNTSGKNDISAGYSCVQPAGSGPAVTGSQAWCTSASGGTGGSCDLDNYTPNLAALALIQTGPAGPQGVPGAIGATGVPGGSLSYPGVTTNGSDGLSITGGVTAASVIAPNLEYQAIDIFGDSISQGTGSTTFMAPGVKGQQTCWQGDIDYPTPTCSPTGPTSYSYMLLSDYGNAGHDYGRGGDTSADMAWHVAIDAHPTLQNNPVRTAQIGTNDLNTCGSSSACLDTATRSELFAAAQATIPDSLKIFASASTLGGTWTADSRLPGAMNTTTSGATVEAAVQSSTGYVYVAYQRCDNTTSATGTITINGVAGTLEPTINFFPQGGSDIYFNNQSSYASGSGEFSHCTLALARNQGVVGSNLVQLTTTGSGSWEVFWMAGAYTAPAGAIAPPLMVIGGTIVQQSGAGQPGVNDYNSVMNSVYSTMLADGNNVLWANIQQYMNTTVDFNGGVEPTPDAMCGAYSPSGAPWAASWLPPLHPGDGGQCHIYEAFHNVLNPQLKQSQALSIFGGPQGTISGYKSFGGRYGADNGLATVPSESILDFNNTGNEAQVGLDFETPGSNSMTFRQWGTGNPAGLSGVTGLWDLATSNMVWNTDTHDDFCALSITSAGTPNLNGCAGAPFFVQGGNATNGAFRVGIGTTTPGVFNGEATSGAGAMLQVDSGTVPGNAQLAIQTNSSGYYPILHFVNDQAASGFRDWTIYHNGSGLIFGMANDTETGSTPVMTITTTGVTFNQPITVPACTGCPSGGGGGGGSSTFNSLTGGTNTTAAMLVGSGSSLGPSGTGTVTANAITGTPNITVGSATASTATITNAPNAFLTIAGTGSGSTSEVILNTPGSNSIEFEQWGSGNGNGLPGVVGLWDETSGHFIWQSDSTDDLFGYTPGNSSNVAGGVGSTWSINHTGAATFSTINVGSCTGCGTGTGNTTASSLTTNAIPKATGTTAIGNSLLSDSGTALTYTGTGGMNAPTFNGTGTTPAALLLPSGTGSIPALSSGSAGFAAPASGGTSYLFKLPASVVTGVLHAAAVSVGVDGVNESTLTSSLIGISDLSATGTASSTAFLRGDNSWHTPLTPIGYGLDSAPVAGTSWVSAYSNSISTSNEASREVLMPASVTVTALMCNTTATQPSTGSLVIALRTCNPGSNGSCTASNAGPTVTFAASQTSSTMSDTTDTAVIPAGYVFDLQITNNASSAGANIASCMMALESNN